MAPFDNGETNSPAKFTRLDSHDVALDGAAVLFEQNQILRSANPAPNEGILLAQASGPLVQQGSGSAFRDAIRNRVPVAPIGNYPPGDVGVGQQTVDQRGVEQRRVDQRAVDQLGLDQLRPNQQRAVQPGGLPQRFQTATDRVPTPVSNLPGLKFAPTTPVEPSLIDSTGIKKSKLDEPFKSETSDQANTMFELMAGIGSSAFFVNRDYVKRSAALEAKIASTPLVSPGNVQNFQAARDGLLGSLKTPIQNAEVAMEAMVKRYPTELFQGSTVPKIGETGGKIMIPHAWDLDKLSIADQAVAEKYLKLSSLRETLMAHWPPVASTQLGRLPLNIQGMPFVQAENLVAEAARFDAAGSAFTGEVTKVLNNNSALRAANTNLVFKSAGTLAGAWVTNRATDALVDTKHGPSMVTWAADIASPAILFTNKSMLTKFGVVTVSHLGAKLYDKWTEKE
jgi:hypothetical protein